MSITKKTDAKKPIAPKPKKQPDNPVIILFALCISKMYADYPFCPKDLIGKYNEAIEQELTNRKIKKEDINFGTVLKKSCTGTYTPIKKGNAVFSYALKPFVDVEKSFETICTDLPEGYSDAFVAEKALQILLGVKTAKCVEEIQTNTKKYIKK